MMILIELPKKIFDINNAQMNNYQFNILLETYENYKISKYLCR